MNERTIGTCSICGGAVTIPELWAGISEPILTCKSCGAVASKPRVPVIPMQPAPVPFVERGGWPVGALFNREMVHEVTDAPISPVFVVRISDLADGRRYEKPLTRVGHVPTGSMREFESGDW